MISLIAFDMDGTVLNDEKKMCISDSLRNQASNQYDGWYSIGYLRIFVNDSFGSVCTEYVLTSCLINTSFSDCCIDCNDIANHYFGQ